MTYFRNVETLEELRKQYKELLKKFHPDNANGSTEATQEINAEYDNLFRKFKQGYEHSEEYQKATERQRQSYDFVKEYVLGEIWCLDVFL